MSKLSNNMELERSGELEVGEKRFSEVKAIMKGKGSSDDSPEIEVFWERILILELEFLIARRDLMFCFLKSFKNLVSSSLVISK